MVKSAVTSLIPLEAILAAEARLHPYLSPSPVLYAESYSRRLGARVVFKLELFLPTHSFKVRGALNAVLGLSPAARERGVITASAGNHGLGLSYAAKLTGVKATVVLPTGSPRVRAEAIRNLGGEVIVSGEDWNAANAYALELVRKWGYTYISPFDNPAVMAGQGTLALEILRQVPEASAILCSVGGGGLISGIASAVRQLRPEVRVVGVEPLGADCMSQSVRARHIIELPHFTSIAESLGVRRPGEQQLAIVKEAVERMVTVTDEATLRELLFTLNEEKLLCEPAASCTLAALTAGLVPEIRGKTVVPVLCGGNITLGHVQAWMKRFGLAAEGSPQTSVSSLGSPRRS